MCLTGNMDGAVSLVDIDMGTVGDVEWRIESDIHFVIRSLSVHFALGWAVAPNKFILAVYRDIRVFNGEIEVDIACVFLFAGHAGVIFFFVICTGVRHPAPVTRIGIDGFLAGDICYPVPLVAGTAIELFILRRNVERIVLTNSPDASYEEHIDAEAAGRFDDG